MRELHKLDNQYGNIEDKLKKTIKQTNNSLKKIDKFINLMNNLEQKTVDTIELNEKRILDL